MMMVSNGFNFPANGYYNPPKPPAKPIQSVLTETMAYQAIVMAGDLDGADGNGNAKPDGILDQAELNNFRNASYLAGQQAKANFEATGNLNELVLFNNAQELSRIASNLQNKYATFANADPNGNGGITLNGIQNISNKDGNPYSVTYQDVSLQEQPPANYGYPMPQYGQLPPQYGNQPSVNYGYPMPQYGQLPPQYDNQPSVNYGYAMPQYEQLPPQYDNQPPANYGYPMPQYGQLLPYNSGDLPFPVPYPVVPKAPEDLTYLRAKADNPNAWDGKQLAVGVNNRIAQLDVDKDGQVSYDEAMTSPDGLLGNGQLKPRPGSPESMRIWAGISGNDGKMNARELASTILSVDSDSDGTVTNKEDIAFGSELVQRAVDRESAARLYDYINEKGKRFGLDNFITETQETKDVRTVASVSKQTEKVARRNINVALNKTTEELMVKLKGLDPASAEAKALNLEVIKTQLTAGNTRNASILEMLKDGYPEDPAGYTAGGKDYEEQLNMIASDVKKKSQAVDLNPTEAKKLNNVANFFENVAGGADHPRSYGSSNLLAESHLTLANDVIFGNQLVKRLDPASPEAQKLKEDLETQINVKTYLPKADISKLSPEGKKLFAIGEDYMATAKQLQTADLSTPAGKALQTKLDTLEKDFIEASNLNPVPVVAPPPVPPPTIQPPANDVPSILTQQKEATIKAAINDIPTQLNFIGQAREQLANTLKAMVDEAGANLNPESPTAQALAARTEAIKKQDDALVAQQQQILSIKGFLEREQSAPQYTLKEFQSIMQVENTLGGLKTLISSLKPESPTYQEAQARINILEKARERLINHQSAEDLLNPNTN